MQVKLQLNPKRGVLLSPFSSLPSPFLSLLSFLLSLLFLLSSLLSFPVEIVLRHSPVQVSSMRRKRVVKVRFRGKCNTLSSSHVIASSICVAGAAF